jgi:hypothetical protein
MIRDPIYPAVHNPLRVPPRAEDRDLDVSRRRLRVVPVSGADTADVTFSVPDRRLAMQRCPRLLRPLRGHGVW